MHGETRLPEEFRGQGEYHHLYWDLVLAGDTMTRTFELASLHELFHADLDTTTDFGTLLCAFSYLRRRFGDASAYSATHGTLVTHSRRTHETCATFMSLLSIADPGGDDGSGFALQEYAEYVRMGQDLCRGLSSRFFRFHAALASIRACMQAPVTEIALQRGLDSFRLRDLTPALLPDERLTALRQVVAQPQFWQRAIERLREGAPDHPEWEHALAAEGSDNVFTQLFGSAEDGLSALLLRGFHEILAERLEHVGMPTLPYGGHMEFATRIVEAAQELAGARTVGGFGLTVGEPDHGLLGAALHFERERTVIRTTRIRASILPIPVEQYLDETTDSLENPAFSFYIAVRWPERVAEQFDFSDEDLEALRSAAGTPWCFVQAGVDDDEGHVILIVPLRTPADIATLAAAAPCYSSVSSAALDQDDWREWRDALSRHTSMTVLWDSSPFRQIRRWAEQRIPCIRFGREEVHTEEGQYSLFWVRPELEGAPMFLAPVSFVVSVALTVYLKRMTDKYGLVLVGDGARPDDIAVLRPVAYHLFREEAWFDFTVNVD